MLGMKKWALLFVIVGYGGAALYHFTSVSQNLTTFVCPLCLNVDPSRGTHLGNHLRYMGVLGTANAVLSLGIGFSILLTLRYFKSKKSQ